MKIDFTSANSADIDEIPHSGSSLYAKGCISSGLSLFANIKKSSGTEIHHFIEILTCNPLKYKMNNSIL